MTKEPTVEENITQADIEKLLAENVLAAEQLRRIVAVRLAGAYKAEIQRWRDRDNGVGAAEEIVAATVSEE